MTAHRRRRFALHGFLWSLTPVILGACSQSPSGLPTQVVQPPVVQPPDVIRSIDGSGNNALWPETGSVGMMLVRLVEPGYADGVSQMAGANRPGPRVISNIVSAHPPAPRPNSARATDFVWQWGQFVDHDMDFTNAAEPSEFASIPIPANDPYFDPDGTGTKIMEFRRSAYAPGTGTGIDNPRQQINTITAWIDASNVYGSDAERAAALRTNDGTGRLKTSAGKLLPFNTDSLDNEGSTSPDLFLAGDVRANEQVALTALHTLFVREHNRLADLIRSLQLDYTGDQIYQIARRIVGAQMQSITYNEFLPVLLGSGAIAPYEGYDESVDASIYNVFSTALYRFGHSTLSPTLLRLDSDGNETAFGHLPLSNAFFTPSRIIDEGGIDPLLRGLARQIHEDVDIYVVDAVRNMLFGPPGTGGLDIVALNIQRGRDHGLPSYNETRIAYGLAPKSDWADISSDPETQSRLSQTYATVDDIDVWVGALAEDHVSGMVGELIFYALSTQYEALRDGDRYWYERTLSPWEMQQVGTLADIIRRNTDIGDELQDNVFLLP